ncbi:MarR family winged helix-turn-helix transcriptional regulator [Salinibacterium soli]|uniref:MarR family transcriptional regulator n=1 Tax=Antiquaquibacter soli TaxID=3064523 RepID=A0ABT9BK29_9MICO|nr:MarR family transcriptional regulator [Protaetiibacter sp. WY-16]MDO7880793.1 MarR family transcriptional regulator [Protaetiibacter sp. WY-16]
MRRSPTSRDLVVWREFVETGDRLRSLLSSRLQSQSQLSSGDYAVLLALSEADGRSIRSSDLAAAIDWERSRLSHHLGRMESRGLVRREACATDNRGAEVVLTETGASLFRAASVPHLRAVRELFLDALSPEQLDAIDGITRALREHLDVERGSSAR